MTKEQINKLHRIIINKMIPSSNMVESITEQNNSKCTKIETTKEFKTLSLEIQLSPSSFRTATWTCNSHSKSITNTNWTISMPTAIYNNLAWVVWMICKTHISHSRRITQLQTMRWSTQIQTAWTILPNLTHSHPIELF
jgi:hypothetical protein